MKTSVILSVVKNQSFPGHFCIFLHVTFIHVNWKETELDKNIQYWSKTKSPSSHNSQSCRIGETHEQVSNISFMMEVCKCPQDSI